MDIDKILKYVGVVCFAVLGWYIVYKAFTLVIWLACNILLAMMVNPVACIGILVLLMATLYFFFKWQDRRD